MLVKPEEVGLSAPRLARLRTHLQRYIEAGKVAGTLTLVARHGQIAYFEPQGHLEIEQRRPMQRDAIFRIYSMSKPITSVAVMMLYEQGLFQLDDPVHKFIPAWKNLRVFVSGNHPTFITAPVERAMTMRDLLSHTSGLTYGFMERTNVDAAYRKLGVADRTRPGSTLQDMINTLAELPLEFSPGHALELFCRHGRAGVSGGGHIGPTLRCVPARSGAGAPGHGRYELYHCPRATAALCL